MGTENEIEILKRKAFYLEVISSFATKLMRANSNDEIVWTVANHIVASLGYVDCIVYLLDENRNVLCLRAAHGTKMSRTFDSKNARQLKIGRGIMGAVAQSGVGEIVADTSLDDRYLLEDEARDSEITIPIMAKDKVIGIIDSEHPEKNYYSQDDFDVLTTIAEMTSAKLQQVKVQEELRAHKIMLEDKVLAKTHQLQSTIEELKESNEAILNQNKEKETLIKEIHHRVKNNLQVLTSLMNIHAAASDNEHAKEAFTECKYRIYSMSAIHEQLYMSDNMSEINVRQYMSDIAIDLLHSFGASSRVKLTLEVEDRSFDIAISIPLGLVLNELIVNSLKHGIRDSEGELKISLTCKNESALLVVQDSGTGFSKTNPKGTSIGIELIETLTTQLEGELTYISNEAGTICQLTFPSGQNY